MRLSDVTQGGLAGFAQSLIRRINKKSQGQPEDTRFIVVRVWGARGEMVTIVIQRTFAQEKNITRVFVGNRDGDSVTFVRSLSDYRRGIYVVSDDHGCDNNPASAVATANCAFCR